MISAGLSQLLSQSAPATWSTAELGRQRLPSPGLATTNSIDRNLVMHHSISRSRDLGFHEPGRGIAVDRSPGLDR
jgi:hypothetical protein